MVLRFGSRTFGFQTTDFRQNRTRRGTISKTGSHFCRAPRGSGHDAGSQQAPELIRVATRPSGGSFVSFANAASCGGTCRSPLSPQVAPIDRGLLGVARAFQRRGFDVVGRLRLRNVHNWGAGRRFRGRSSIDPPIHSSTATARHSGEHRPKRIAAQQVAAEWFSFVTL